VPRLGKKVIFCSKLKFYDMIACKGPFQGGLILKKFEIEQGKDTQKMGAVFHANRESIEVKTSA